MKNQNYYLIGTEIFDTNIRFTSDASPYTDGMWCNEKVVGVSVRLER